MHHLLSPAISRAAAAAREHHLTQAEALSAEIDMLEHHGRCEVRAKVPSVAHHGQSLLDVAKMLKVKLRVHVRHVTDLTDYTPATGLADEQWRSHLHELAHEARQQALSDRQVKSRLDSHYHEKAA